MWLCSIECFFHYIWEGNFSVALNWLIQRLFFFMLTSANFSTFRLLHGKMPLLWAHNESATSENDPMPDCHSRPLTQKKRKKRRQGLRGWKRKTFELVEGRKKTDLSAVRIHAKHKQLNVWACLASRDLYHCAMIPMNRKHVYRWYTRPNLYHPYHPHHPPRPPFSVSAECVCAAVRIRPRNILSHSQSTLPSTHTPSHPLSESIPGRETLGEPNWSDPLGQAVQMSAICLQLPLHEDEIPQQQRIKL